MDKGIEIPQSCACDLLNHQDRRIEELEVDLEIQRDVEEKHIKENWKLKDKIKELKKEKNTLNIRLDAYKKSLKQSSEEWEKMYGERSDLKIKIDDLHGERSDLKAEIARLKCENKQLKQSIKKN